MLLHGLTATRRYVVMGSRALERGGHRVDRLRRARARRVDAGAATRTPTTTTTSSPTSLAVLDDRGIERAVLAGASMGAHTARARSRSTHPERVAGLVIITPAFDPDAPRERSSSAGTRCRRACASAASTASSRPTACPTCPSSGATPIDRVLRQRLAAHEHPDAVADALRAVPRSRAVRALGGPRDDRRADDRRRRAATRPTPATPTRSARPTPRGSRAPSCASRTRASSPLAWQGGQLSKVIAEVAERAAP